jgi:hypothetical protein
MLMASLFMFPEPASSVRAGPLTAQRAVCDRAISVHLWLESLKGERIGQHTLDGKDQGRHLRQLVEVPSASNWQAKVRILRSCRRRCNKGLLHSTTTRRTSSLVPSPTMPSPAIMPPATQSVGRARNSPLRWPGLRGNSLPLGSCRGLSPGRSLGPLWSPVAVLLLADLLSWAKAQSTTSLLPSPPRPNQRGADPESRSATPRRRSGRRGAATAAVAVAAAAATAVAPFSSSEEKGPSVAPTPAPARDKVIYYHTGNRASGATTPPKPRAGGSRASASNASQVNPSAPSPALSIRAGTGIRAPCAPPSASPTRPPDSPGRHPEPPAPASPSLSGPLRPPRDLPSPQGPPPPPGPAPTLRHRPRGFRRLRPRMLRAGGPAAVGGGGMEGGDW